MATKAAAPKSIVLVLGRPNRHALRKQSIPTDSRTIHSVETPYFGSRNGRDDATWDEHKASVRASNRTMVESQCDFIAEAFDSGIPVQVYCVAGWDAFDKQSGIFPVVGTPDAYRELLEYIGIVPTQVDVKSASRAPF